MREIESANVAPEADASAVVSYVIYKRFFMCFISTISVMSEKLTYFDMEIDCANTAKKKKKKKVFLS